MLPAREPSARAAPKSNGRPCGPSRQRKYAHPSQLTGRGGRPENQSGGRRRPVLCQLSYAPRGRRDSNPQPQDPRRNPRLRNRPTRLSRCGTTAEASIGCEARARTWSSCFRDRRGSSSTTSQKMVGGLDGEIRTPNLRLPTPARSRCATSRWSERVRAGYPGSQRTTHGGGVSVWEPGIPAASERPMVVE